MVWDAASSSLKTEIGVVNHTGLDVTVHFFHNFGLSVVCESMTLSCGSTGGDAIASVLHHAAGM
jgi:hypothetical protein